MTTIQLCGIVAGGVLAAYLIGTVWWRRRHPPTSERREHVRVEPLRALPIDVRLVDDRTCEVLRVIDIGAGGMRVDAHGRLSQLTQNRTLRFLLKIPAYPAIKVWGRLKHIHSIRKHVGRLGVQFTDLSQEDRDQIAAYVERALSSPAQDKTDPDLEE